MKKCNGGEAAIRGDRMGELSQQRKANGISTVGKAVNRSSSEEPSLLEGISQIGCPARTRT
jgi:hypothetical protein